MDTSEAPPTLLVADVPNLGKACVASHAFKKGDTIFVQTGIREDRPNMYTIQLDEHVHVEVGSPMRFLAHSCAPSCGLQFSDMNVLLVALRDINPGDITSFDYCTSEWFMASPFTCECGAKQCRKFVAGLEPLTRTNPLAAAALRDQLTPFILKAYTESLEKKECSAASAVHAQSPTYAVA